MTYVPTEVMNKREVAVNFLASILASIIATFVLMWSWNQLVTGYQIEYTFWNCLAAFFLTTYFQPYRKKDLK